MTMCLMCKGVGYIESPPPKAPLTDAQAMVLRAVIEWISTHGYPPSVREVAEASGLSSSSTTHGHLCRLRDKGYIIFKGIRQIVVLHGLDHSHPREGEAGGDALVRVDRL